MEKFDRAVMRAKKATSKMSASEIEQVIEEAVDCVRRE